MYKTIFISLVVLIEVLGASNIHSLSAYESNNDYMKLLNISQSDESKDYIFNKTQFQLSNLTTEQIHYKTKNLSFTDSITDGLLELLSVDQDITNRINSLKRDEIEKLEDLKENIKEMIMTEGRVYVYGTGSTGRLAKQVENIWRRFWNKFNIKDLEGIKDKLSNFFPNFDKMQDKFIGDITGGDRALIKSLEGFEDLQIIGKLQLLDYNITSKDMVLTFTEGGETSAVIGCALAASEIIQNKSKVYFFYNNPDEILIKFDRSKSVLLNDKITKINFTTGPQAITGSTRMQATSSQTFLISCVIEQALSEVLSEILDKEEIYYMGFSEKPSIIESLNNFETLRLTVYDNIKKLGNYLNTLVI
jgi:N-acetylmuramic acid 6-phosphate etherase